MPLQELNVLSKRLIIHQGADIGAAISAAKAFDQRYVIPDKLKTGEYNHRTFVAEGNPSGPLHVWHTKTSIVVTVAAEEKEEVQTK